jgi:hypothetical protein
VKSAFQYFLFKAIFTYLLSNKWICHGLLKSEDNNVYTLSSTKLEIRAKQYLLGSMGVG